MCIESFLGSVHVVLSGWSLLGMLPPHLRVASNAANATISHTH